MLAATGRRAVRGHRAEHCRSRVALGADMPRIPNRMTLARRARYSETISVKLNSMLLRMDSAIVIDPAIAFRLVDRRQTSISST